MKLTLLRTRVNDSRRIQISFGIAALGMVVAIAAVFARHYLNSSGALSIFDIGYDNGPLVRNLVLHHTYGSMATPGGVWSVAQRLPLVPLFLAVIASITPSLLPAFAIKNVLFWSLTFLAFLRTARMEDSPVGLLYAAFLLLVLLPYNSYVAFAIEYEEGYLFHLAILLFAFLAYQKRRRDLVVIGALLSLVYLTKSSMAGVCVVVALAAIVEGSVTNETSNRGLQNKLDFVIPACVLLAAACSWGTFTLLRSGHFAMGSTTSSLNGLNLYKGNNPSFAGLYPEINLDVLDLRASFAPNRPVRNEWDLNGYYENEARKFIFQNPGQTLRNDLTKFYVAFAGIEDVELGARNRWLVRGNMLVNRVLLWTSIVLATENIRRQWRKRNWSRLLPSLYLLGFIAAWVPPYIAGFVNNRQMVPVFGVCALFLFLEISNRVGPSLQGASRRS